MVGNEYVSGACMFLRQGVSGNGRAFRAWAGPDKGQSGDSVHWLHTCAHYPLAVIADSDTLTGLFKLEVLQQFDTTCVLRIGFQTSFSLSGKPFR